MQRSRRVNPYPFTWEIPGALVAAVLLLVLLGVQVGRSVANVLAGNGWVFVDRENLFSSLGGILDGNAAAGLAGVAEPASATLIWLCLAGVEVGAVAVCVCAGRWAAHRWGPGRLKGMATSAEAEALLGRTRLRRHAKVIRPDLYGDAKRGTR